MNAQRTYQLVALAFVLAGLFALCTAIISRSGGMLFYTIDDPYIHQAVAENILRGGVWR